MNSCTILETGSTVNVGMGQTALLRAPGTINSILGSCIGVAIYHPRLEVGALAHVVLPESAGRPGPPGKFADKAIDHLLELLAKEQAPSAGLVAKFAGGASMFNASGPMQIGEANIAAVTEQLQAKRIRVAGTHVGGNKGRRITFNVRTGELVVEIVGLPPIVL